MCFVEFDDVSFATRALAELYGRQLPRSTVSSKGGIRLSFSKNPLGVRGPNSRRGGIVNGIDTDLLDPETDTHIPYHFSVKDLSGKANEGYE